MTILLFSYEIQQLFFHQCVKCDILSFTTLLKMFTPTRRIVIR